MRKVFTVVTRSWHLSLSWTTWIQSTPSHLIALKYLFNIIFPSTPTSSKLSHFFRFSRQYLDAILFFPSHNGCLAVIIFLDFIILIIHGIFTIMEIIFRYFSPLFCYFILPKDPALFPASCLSIPSVKWTIITRLDKTARPIMLLDIFIRKPLVSRKYTESNGSRHCPYLLCS